ncbi:uncharacterized protein LOC124654401 isoform X1 [Lolium rigidum]|uniref:uncharacterized protein LOC124654401 isoform X1 n=1 Tax=Lolium rigidum TaxID=89674 RepID=UPI001F5C5884|nr:uncharacterized protein LOC124654401 isoform X1 [Lolium rigidum]
MDGGGDARLPRNKGKTKRAPAAAPPPPPESGRGRDRFEALWHDYHDLLQETEAKKRRLERMHRRKLGLLAEVKFLRKKFSSFVNDDPQQTQYSLKNKKPRQQIPSTLGMNEGPSTSKGTNMDLNQDSAMLQNGVGAGRQGYQDHSEPGRHDLAGVDEDMMNSNVNMSLHRGTGNSPATDDKRATAWQDRVALKI